MLVVDVFHEAIVAILEGKFGRTLFTPRNRGENIFQGIYQLGKLVRKDIYVLHVNSFTPRREEMEAVDTFIALYRELDEYLRHHAREESTWYRRIDALAYKNAAFRRNAEKLKDYGDLRNAIEHRNGGVIAIPTEEAIQEFKQIRDDILSPPKLISRFKKSDIRVFRPDEPLVAALQHMRDNDFSQEVVQVEGKLFLLTVEGIARWLEGQAQEDIISVQEAVIADALRYEPKGSFVIKGRDQTVYDAMEVFTPDLGQEKPRVYALLITEHGKATERVLGLATPWDRLFG